MRVEVLNIGTELLMGFVVNTHASYLGRKLGELGLRIDRQVGVNDEPADIRNALSDALQRAELVITTGGLGPTSDDITRDLVIELLKLPTRVDERVLRDITKRFQRHKIAMPESVKVQATVPVDAHVLHNANGTAPGLAIPLKKSEWKCRMLVLLPGPPRELCPMFEDQVLPLLKREWKDLPIVECRMLRTVGLAESLVEEAVKPVLARHPEVEIGYCARSGEVDVRLVARGKDAAKIADTMERELREALGGVVFGNSDEGLQNAVVELLKTRGKTLATAESCTGGYLAHRITMVSGSSDVFQQGWITYANEAKQERLGVPADLLKQHGAVSESVARRMAEGARERAKSDYALSVTGIAGPTGGTPEKPVGTVYIALATANGTSVTHALWPMDRETFKFVVSQTALDMLRRELLDTMKTPAEKKRDSSLRSE